MQPHNIIQNTFLYWPPGVCEYYKEAIHIHIIVFPLHKFYYGHYSSIVDSLTLRALLKENIWQTDSEVTILCSKFTTKTPQ